MGLPPRVASKIDFESSKLGCWLWTASLREGYGQVRRGRSVIGAHRAVYELLVGPIPAGLTLDHLCRVTRCVNPEHLEPVTWRENVLRGDGHAAVNARKTHCPSGHPYDRVSKAGQRVCSTCKAAYRAMWLARRNGLAA